MVSGSLLATGILLMASAQATKKSSEIRQASFVLVGDSTTFNSTTPNSGGWGNGFCASLAPGVSCQNFASNGATTGTIVTRGNYAAALNATRAEVDAGREVFVTFQFGHNDQKIAPPSSMGANLTRFVGDVYAISARAHPILITPLSRRNFVNGTDKINNALADWATETARVASATNTTLLPLNAASINYLQAIGPNASTLLNRLPADFTHLNLGGQALFGRMVADLMNVIVGFGAAVPCVEPPFVPNPPLSSAIWGGQQYVFEAVCPSYNASECVGDVPRPQ